MEPALLPRRHPNPKSHFGEERRPDTRAAEIEPRFTLISEKFNKSISAANQVASWRKLDHLLLMYYHILNSQTPCKLCKRLGRVLKYLVELTARH